MENQFHPQQDAAPLHEPFPQHSDAPRPTAACTDHWRGSDDAENDLRVAQELYDQGNFPQAEIYVRRALVSAPRHPEALARLQDLRRAYGMADDFILSENEPPSEIEKTRFLVIKAWGYGFWSEGHHLASQLLLAELTHRTPVVLWGKNCLFRGNADLDASTHFFQEISTARLEDLPSTSRFFPGKWSWANLREENVNKWEGEGSRIAAQYLFARPEEVLVSDFFSNIETIRPWIGPSSKYFGKSDDEIYAVLFQKYLKPTSSIASRADTFFNQIKQSRPWIAVHVRGSDKVLESPRLQETNAACLNLLDQIIEQHPTLGVLLLTDSTPIVAEYQERYGERLRCTEATRSATDVGVHLSGHNGVELGEEVFVDTLLALKCDFFIGNRMSNVSLAIASLRDWPAGHIHLFGENSGRGENLLLHRRPAKDGPACRLCDAPTIAKFSRLLLSRYTVTYFACTKCDSLQTETPHWLDEAYSPTHEPVDAGAAGRTLLNVLSLCRLLEIIGIRKEDRCVDFYGGNGLFARLMRDAGYNFFSQDKFGNDAFCRGFAWSSLDRPVQLITIFESGEQFTYPSAKWDALFASNPNFILGTTGLYTNQGSDWALLSPESGRNTFFYSPTALAEIAASRGWEAYLLGDYFLLSRQPLSEKTLSDLEEWNQNLDCAIKESLHHWSNNSQEFVSEDNRHLRQLLRLRESGTRIAVDGFFFRFASGIARVWKSLLAEWSADGFGEFVVVLDRERTAPRFAGITYLDIPCHTYADRLADREMLQEICDRETISLFISTYYTTPTKTPAVLMVHDMIPEVLGFDLSSEQWREKHEAIRYCHHYLCVSNSTVSDLIRIFPHISQDRIRLAHCGTDFRTPSREGITNFLERYGINQPYFLISGTKTDYKNAHLFFKAFASLGAARSDYAIVCTNSKSALEPEFSEWIGPARVHLLVLSDEDLQCAYGGALALAYPSRYEGFGLPILEAMACSCPVITCNNSSIGEVAGDAAIYVSPDDIPAMRKALLSVQQEENRNQMIQKGQERVTHFSWRKMAHLVENALIQWSTEAIACNPPESLECSRPTKNEAPVSDKSTNQTKAILDQAPAPASSRKLHIGGKSRADGWEVLNALPGPDIDHVCNANNLSQFADATFDEIYASHVVEHFDYMEELTATLTEWNRVLVPGGKIYISVPDLDILASLLLEKEKLTDEERFFVMRMMFGGHIDEFDYHIVGLNEVFLAAFLEIAGFVNINRVDTFGLFNDTSNKIYKGVAISLNVTAEKPF